MNFSLVLGWRNLWRNSRRTALAVLTIAIGQFSLVWIDSFLNGYEGLIKERLTGPMLGDLQLHHPTYRKDNAVEKTIPDWQSAQAELAAKPHVVHVLARVYAPVLVSLKEEGHVGQIMGLEFSRENGRGGLLEGLRPDRFPSMHEVVVGSGLAKDMRLKPGDQLAVMGQAADGSIASGLFTVKEVVSTASDQANQSGLMISVSSAQELLSLSGGVHELIVHTDGAVFPEVVQAEVEGIAAFAHLETLTWKQLSPQMADLLRVFRGANLVVLVLVFATTISGVANTLLMSTFERTHEIGMLLALGCQPGRLNRILLLESVIQGVLGGLLGSVTAIFLVMWQARRGIDLSFLVHAGTRQMSLSMEGLSFNFQIFPVLSLGDVQRGLLVVMFTSMVACYLPARKISRMEPVEALRA